MTEHRVSFRAHFERFPAAVKGAFVLRAADGIPHQVVFHEATLVELAGGPRRSLGLEGVVQDVAPTLDLFVPFEFPFTELTSGWYGLDCKVLVDGTPERVRPGRRFGVPWPRATTRRGSFDVGKAVDVGRTKVRFDRVELAGDHSQLTYDGAAAPGLKLAADGRALVVLENEHDRETGRGRVTAYPVLRTERGLSIEVPGGPVVEVALPP